MLKIVVFDGGYGGEFFADQLKTELPIIEIIRVINWRNADKLLNNPKDARKIAIDSLRPYIGKVDLIVFANYLLSVTSLKYFRKKYKNQRFLGLNLKHPDTFIKNDTLIMSTKALSKTLQYRYFVRSLRRNTKTITLDSWPDKIDDGELTKDEIKDTISRHLAKINFHPKEIILTCSQFHDIKPELKELFGYNTRIYDGFDDTLRKVYKILGIRGGTGKKQ